MAGADIAFAVIGAAIKFGVWSYSQYEKFGKGKLVMCENLDRLGALSTVDIPLYTQFAQVVPNSCVEVSIKHLKKYIVELRKMTSKMKTKGTIAKIIAGDDWKELDEGISRVISHLTLSVVMNNGTKLAELPAEVQRRNDQLLWGVYECLGLQKQSEAEAPPVYDEASQVRDVKKQLKVMRHVLSGMIEDFTKAKSKSENESAKWTKKIEEATSRKKQVELMLSKAAGLEKSMFFSATRAEQKNVRQGYFWRHRKRIQCRVHYETVAENQTLANGEVYTFIPVEFDLRNSRQRCWAIQHGEEYLCTDKNAYNCSFIWKPISPAQSTPDMRSICYFDIVHDSENSPYGFNLVRMYRTGESNLSPAYRQYVCNHESRKKRITEMQPRSKFYRYEVITFKFTSNGSKHETGNCKESEKKVDDKRGEADEIPEREKKSVSDRGECSTSASTSGSKREVSMKGKRNNADESAKSEKGLSSDNESNTEKKLVNVKNWKDWVDCFVKLVDEFHDPIISVVKLV